MGDLSEQELAAIRAERGRQFTGPWFADLLAGRLGPGETFWMGWLGVILIAVPALILFYLLIGGVSEAAATGLAVAVLGGLAFYRLALMRALWLSLRRQGRIAGVGTAGLAVSAVDVIAFGGAALALALS